MTTRLPLLLLTLALLAPASFAADGPPARDNVLDQMGDTGNLLGSALRDTPTAAPSDAAGPTPNCGMPGQAPCPPPDAPAVPVDGGLTLLALAGAGYATRKLRARRA